MPPLGERSYKTGPELTEAEKLRLAEIRAKRREAHEVMNVLLPDEPKNIFKGRMMSSGYVEYDTPNEAPRCPRMCAWLERPRGVNRIALLTQTLAQIDGEWTKVNGPDVRVVAQHGDISYSQTTWAVFEERTMTLDEQETMVNDTLDTLLLMAQANGSASEAVDYLRSSFR